MLVCTLSYVYIFVCIRFEHSFWLQGEHLVPELQSKIVEWLKNHANIGPPQRNFKVRFKNITKVEAGATDEADVIVSESCIPDVSVTSIPPRRRTKSDIRILKDGKALCLTRSDSIGNGISMAHNGAQHLIRNESASQSEESVPDTSQKVVTIQSLFIFKQIYVMWSCE